MPELLAFLGEVKKELRVIMVYLAEAHADDVWPLGYGINSPKTTEERWTNCNKFLSKHKGLKD
jgi:hypothetical protein